MLAHTPPAKRGAAYKPQLKTTIKLNFNHFPVNRDIPVNHAGFFVNVAIDKLPPIQE